MRIADYFADPMMRDVVLTALAAGLGVVVMCGVLSPIVVVKRLGFVGQGVSHSAFGGIGVASLLAALGVVPSAVGSGAGSGIQLVIVLAFCVAAALGMAAMSDRRSVPVDTAIGLFLVASMAVGAILVEQSRLIAIAHGTTQGAQSWESILFGSVLAAGHADAAIGWGVCAVVLLTSWWMRRMLAFWSLDEESARAFGVPTRGVRIMLLVLLSLAIVVAMKLAGVVLATALLVLPGAAALKLSARMPVVLVLSVLLGTAALVGGLAISLQFDWQAGPSIVLVLTGLFGCTWVWETVRGSGRSGGATEPSAAPRIAS